ncbi:major facilitator superfamily domain-containing protein [Aspergillus insuetus]
MLHYRPRAALNELFRSRPVMLDLRSSDVLIIIAIAAALFTDSFLYTLVVPVIPTALRVRVGLPQEEQQKWTSILLSLYAAALLVASPPLGYLADRSSSRRLPLLLGLLALAGSTGLLCVGTTVGLWAAGRFSQGLSAAVVWAVGFALMRDTIPPEKFGQVSGILGMASSVGSMTGPLLGGILYQRGGYYAVYGLAFGVIGIDVVLRFLLIEKRQAAMWLAGSELQLESRCGPSITHEAQNICPGHTPADSVVPVQSSSWQLTSLLLRSPRLGSVLGGYLVIALIGACFNTVLPLFVEDTFGWQQMGQGLIFIPLAAPHAFDPLVGKFIDHRRRSSRYFAGGAMILSVPVYVLLRLVVRNSLGQKVLLCVLLTLIGLSLAVCLPPLMLEVSRELSRMEERDPYLFNKGGATAQAYGMLNSAWATGNLVGPYLAGYIRQAAGWDTITWVLGLIAGITAVPLFLYLGGWIGKNGRVHAD